MTQILHFMAMPLSSTFYARLRSDKIFAEIMLTLHNYRDGVFRFDSADELDEEEEGVIDDLIDTLADLIEDGKGEAGRRKEARRQIDAFFSETGELRMAHPGIEDRSLFLDRRITEAIGEIVSRELARTGQVPGLESLFFMKRLFWGEEPVPPSGASDTITVVPAELVAQAAHMLREMDSFELFDDDYREDFESWRELVREAAKRGEAILVAVS